MVHEHLQDELHGAAATRRPSTAAVAAAFFLKPEKDFLWLMVDSAPQNPGLSVAHGPVRHRINIFVAGIL